MKIVYISYSFIPSRTANSVHVMKMCQAFSKAGHEVILLAPNLKSELIKIDKTDFEFYNVSPNFKILKLLHPNIKGGRHIYAFAVGRAISRIKPDLIFGRFLYGTAISTWIGYPVIFESHSPIWISGRVDKIYFRRMIRSNNFRKLIVISDALKKLYDSRYPRINICVAHDGADIPAQSFTSILDSNMFHVGYVGSLYQGRGIEVLIELAERNPNISFHILGGSPGEVKLWTLQLKSKNIHFYGFKEQKEVFNYLSEFDLVLGPYQPGLQTSGGGKSTIDWMSPLKIFEYMSFGKAMIVSEFPVLKEVLEHKRNVLFCVHDNISEWNKSLKLLQKDENLRKKIGNNAKHDFEELYTWDKRVYNILDK